MAVWRAENFSTVGPSRWCNAYDWYVQLIDFGEAHSFDGDTILSELVGTPDYLAPEVLAKRYHPAKADCWSLGVTLWLMLTDSLPFLAGLQLLTLHPVVVSFEI